MALLVTVKMHCTNKLCDHTQNVTRVEDRCFTNYAKHVCDKCGFKTLQDENKKLKFMIDNGLGWEDMQQDSLQSHIN